MLSADSLSPRLARKLSGRCEVQGCSEPCGSASAECPRHHEKSKAYKRSWWKRQTAIRKATHRCRCGAKSKDGRRCRRCKDKIKRDRRSKARLTLPVLRLEVAPQVKLELGRDGATRTRYVPRPGQGGPSREETDRGLLRDLKDGLSRKQRVVTQWPPPRALIDSLPRVQRSEAWDQFVEPLVYDLRMNASVVQSLPTSWARDKICCACGQSQPAEEE